MRRFTSFVLFWINITLCVLPPSLIHWKISEILASNIGFLIFNPLTPVPVMPAVTSLCLSATSDVITFDQNWHHLRLTSAGGKDLSNDTQIRVISPMEPEICTIMLKQSSEKLRAKFPATTRGYSMAKIARLDDAFSECFKLEGSPVEGRSLQQKEGKRKKGKVKKKLKNQKA